MYTYFVGVLDRFNEGDIHVQRTDHSHFSFGIPKKKIQKMSTPHHDGANANNNSTTTRDEGTPSCEYTATVPRMTMQDFFFGNMPDTPLEVEESKEEPILASVVPTIRILFTVTHSMDKSILKTVG